MFKRTYKNVYLNSIKKEKEQFCDSCEKEFTFFMKAHLCKRCFRSVCKEKCAL